MKRNAIVSELLRFVKSIVPVLSTAQYGFRAVNVSLNADADHKAAHVSTTVENVTRTFAVTAGVNPRE